MTSGRFVSGVGILRGEGGLETMAEKQCFNGKDGKKSIYLQYITNSSFASDLGRQL